MVTWNLWVFFVCGYGMIWASMIWADGKRGGPIEDPDIYELLDGERMFICGYLPFIALLAVSFFVPVNDGILLWVGLSIFFAGIALNMVAMYSFAQSTGGLNTTGIYRFSRNPMYVGGFLFVLGLNLMGWSASLMSAIFVVLSILWVGTTHWGVLQEESFLEHKYRGAYLEYKQRVPQYLLKRRKGRSEGI